MSSQSDSDAAAPLPRQAQAGTPHLRAATDADLPFLIDLRERTMRTTLMRVGEPVDPMSHWLRVRYHFEAARVIEADGEPVGLIKTRREPDVWFVIQFQVMPAHQGRGIGAAVLRGLLDEADRARVPLALNVTKSNPVRGWYERFGFEATGETEIEVEMRRAAPPRPPEHA